MSGAHEGRLRLLVAVGDSNSVEAFKRTYAATLQLEKETERARGLVYTEAGIPRGTDVLMKEIKRQLETPGSARLPKLQFQAAGAGVPTWALGRGGLSGPSLQQMIKVLLGIL